MKIVAPLTASNLPVSTTQPISLSVHNSQPSAPAKPMQVKPAAVTLLGWQVYWPKHYLLNAHKLTGGGVM